MSRRLSLSVLLALLALAAVPAAAPAAWFAAQPVDGPSPDIEALGGVDLARDGTGGLVYIKRDGGVPHVFLSRFNGGQFRGAERVDNGIGDGATEAAIAVADGGRLAVVWTAGSRVYSSVVAGGGQQPGPLVGPTEIYNGPGGTASDLAIDMGINGAAYASWAGAGAGGADVRVARLMDTAWTQVGAPMDIDPAQSAGRGTQRSRVGVSAEGNAVVTWGENHADGRARVYMRRVTGLNPSVAPQELSLNEFAGQIGGRADAGRHRHRGRRLVRVGGLPADLRRRLALGRATAAGLDLRPGRAARRRAEHRVAADRHERPRPGPRRGRHGQRCERRVPLQRPVRAERAAELRSPPPRARSPSRPPRSIARSR